MRTIRSAPVPSLLCLFLLMVACARGGSTDPSGATAPTGSTGIGTNGTAGTGGFPLALVDDDGVDVTIDAPPQRIVTFAPSMTEIVFALGLGDRLVGVSGPFDDYPPEAKDIQQVGGAGEFGVDPNLETVVALEPDLFLTIAGGDAWKEQLRELGIPVLTLNATDFDDLLADIGIIGAATGATREAGDLVRQMAMEAEDVERATTERVTCFFEVYFGPTLTTVGPDTFLYDLLERAGCDPVTSDAKSDYPEWSVDELVADAPQVYLATSESARSPAQIASRPGFSGIAAVADGNVAILDPDLVTRPGPRVVEGLRALSAALSSRGD